VKAHPAVLDLVFLDFAFVSSLLCFRLCLPWFVANKMAVAMRNDFYPLWRFLMTRGAVSRIIRLQRFVIPPRCGSERCR
jgi:hypothetical protein